MTRKSFYRVLARIAKQFKWQVESDGALRAYDDGIAFCPLECRSLVKYQSTSIYSNEDINNEDINTIMIAADIPLRDMNNTGDEKYRACRKALFRAVNRKKGL